METLGRVPEGAYYAGLFEWLRSLKMQISVYLTWVWKFYICCVFLKVKKCMVTAVCTYANGCVNIPLNLRECQHHLLLSNCAPDPILGKHTQIQLHLSILPLPKLLEHYFPFRLISISIIHTHIVQLCDLS